LVLDLSDNVRDALGNRLDGEWPNSFGAFPSGDGLPGGDFLFRVNVMPGDVDRDRNVDQTDFRAVLAAQFSARAAAAYSPFADLDGNGVISVQDAVLANNGRTRTFPAGDPTGAPPTLFAQLTRDTAPWAATNDDRVTFESRMDGSIVEVTVGQRFSFQNTQRNPTKRLLAWAPVSSNVMSPSPKTKNSSADILSAIFTPPLTFSFTPLWQPSAQHPSVQLAATHPPRPSAAPATLHWTNTKHFVARWMAPTPPPP
jgi:hypothetical protein